MGDNNNSLPINEEPVSAPHFSLNEKHRLVVKLLPQLAEADSQC